MLAPPATVTPLLRPGPITAGGVLGSPFHGDPWGDAGVLALRDPSIVSGSVAPLSLRAFITEAMPAYGFHRWALVLIALLQQIADGELSRLIVTCPPRLGKLCAHDTPVPTPRGWRRHGDLRPGDEVFGPDGQPTLVLAISAEARATMKVTTTRGEEIWCHPNHEWQVRRRRRRRWETLETRELGSRPLHTGELGRRGSCFLYQLPTPEPLRYPRQDLPLCPYTLGYWLGNGSVGKPVVTHDREDLAPLDPMVLAGYEVSSVHQHRTPGYERVRATSLAGDTRKGKPSPLRCDLLAAGVLQRKHIPEIYLRSSINQRLALLAGLIDSDGSVDTKGRVTFSTVLPELAEAVLDLAEGLGFRPYRSETPAKVSSSVIEGRRTVIAIGFQPTMSIPTQLRRKAIRRLAPQRHAAIARIEHDPGSPHWGRCIQVDRPDGLYVIGRRLTVTHNSLLISKLFLAYFVYRHPHLFSAVASYSGELAYAHSREARHFYRATGNPLSRDSAAVGNWLTPQRGGCIAAGVDGPFNGKGYSLGIIDDPYKGPHDAGSARVRDRIVEWLKSVWFLRAEPSFIDAGTGALQRNLSAQVIVLTRWDENDMVGWLLAQELEQAPQNWHVLDLPAIAEHGPDRPSYPPTVTLEPDWRLPGEPLCPERFPLQELLKIRQRTGAFWWSALYQQRPAPAAGGIFQRAWLRSAFPRKAKRRYGPLILSCDLTF